jgi:hypothetical protein
MSAAHAIAFACGLALCACASDPPETMQSSGGAGGAGGNTSGSGLQPVDDDLVFLSPTEHLTRASIALRGVRPARDELQAVADDANWVEAIIDYYLTTPELGAVIREMHEETLLSGVDPVIYPAGFPAIGALAGLHLQAINSSVVQAPVRLIEHVVANDRPYTEIVTADYTLADENVATVWGLAYDAGGETWQETRWPDERAHAGILSDSFLFTRHSTTYSNKSRGRANAVSRALLCYDFLESEIPVDIGIDLADPEEVANAIENNLACASCHSSLDPLAAHFSSFYPIYVPQDLDTYPFGSFQPTFEAVFRAAEPAYFGEPSASLADLGAHIAKDPRFASCAARRFYSHLAQVDQKDVPLALVSELQAALIESDMDAKALLKAVVMSDAFRVSRARSEEGGEHTFGLKRMRPSALARSVERLTGYRWRTSLPIDIGTGGQVGEVDLMEDSFFGFEVLAGGIDGVSVTRPSNTTSATVTLVAENLAARAAKHVVSADFAEPDASKRRLLRLVEPLTQDDAAVRAQLVDWMLVMFGEELEPSDASVSDAVELFTAALAARASTTIDARDVARAWQLTLYAMLQDPRFLHY